MAAIRGWVWVTLPNGEKKLFKNNNQYKDKKMNKDNSYHLSKKETQKLYSPLTPDFHSHEYETEKYSYSCPIIQLKAYMSQALFSLFLQFFCVVSISYFPILFFECFLSFTISFK